MKKLISILLALILILALVPAAFAAEEEESVAADVLNALGLFKGVGDNADGTPNYDLDRTPNRAEAVTMLVRLLGKQAEADTGAWDMPFTDVDDWAKQNVGYAYANGLTKGTGDTTFDGRSPVTASQYLTFVLRALGYSSETDFRWDAAWGLTDALGITGGEYDETTAEFDRGDMVKISVQALAANMKGAEFTLAEKLMGEGVFTMEQLKDAMVILLGEEGQNPVMNWVGEYRSREAERARAYVECGEGNTAIINIFWSSSVSEETHWLITGELDDETRTISYTGCIKTLETYGPDGALGTQVAEYEDGTGTIVFGEDLTFVWHDDRSDYDRDLTFEWSWTPAEAENPVEAFAGYYQSGRARASVECGEGNTAIINILWGGSAWEEGHWLIVGELDPDTLTISYTGCIKTIDTYEDNGMLGTQTTEYEDGTGTITFSGDGTFTWHDDRSDYSADMVFEPVPEEEDGQNPVMNFVGTYVYGRATAEVECEGTDSARIRIYWSSSYAEHTLWEITGRLDPETLTIRYTGCTKSNITLNEEGPESIVVEYEDGTGTVTFGEDGTLIWHEDQSEYGEDVVMEWVEVVEPEEDGQNPVMNWVGNYQCGRATALVECVGTDSARVRIHWGASAWESAEWELVGELDLETLTVRYSGGRETFVTRNDTGEVVSEEVVNENCTGSIVFGEGPAFTWHDDQSEYEMDMVFEWIPVGD